MKDRNMSHCIQNPLLTFTVDLSVFLSLSGRLQAFATFRTPEALLVPWLSGDGESLVQFNSIWDSPTSRWWATPFVITGWHQTVVTVDIQPVSHRFLPGRERTLYLQKSICSSSGARRRDDFIHLNRQSKRLAVRNQLQLFGGSSFPPPKTTAGWLQ